MKNKSLNIVENAKEISAGIDKLPVNERISFFEHSVEKRVMEFGCTTNLMKNCQY